MTWLTFVRRRKKRRDKFAEIFQATARVRWWTVLRRDGLAPGSGVHMAQKQAAPIKQQVVGVTQRSCDKPPSPVSQTSLVPLSSFVALVKTCCVCALLREPLAYFQHTPEPTGETKRTEKNAARKWTTTSSHIAGVGGLRLSIFCFLFFFPRQAVVRVWRSG